MKNIRLLALSSLMCLSSVGATKLESKINNFSIAPLYFDDLTTDITIGATIVGNHYLSVQIFLINDLYPNGVLIFSNSYTAIKTETFEYNNAYTRPGTNKIKIETTISKNTKSITQNLDVANGKSIKIDSQKYQMNRGQ